MGRISGKDLSDKYSDFLEPCVRVITAAGEIPFGEGLYLERAEIIASVGMDPDMAVVACLADKYSAGGFTGVEKYLDAGQSVEIKTGYGEKASLVFQGYLHQVEVEDFRQEYVTYTLICLDVKGLMMKNSRLFTSGTKKAQQLVNDILKDSRYSSLIKKRTIDALPGKCNPDGVSGDMTDYDWLCSLAAYLDYEFFCSAGELTFRKARKPAGDTVELSVEYGLQKIRGIVSMAGQTGRIEVCGYSRQDQKLSGRADWPGVPGAFTGRLKQSLGSHKLICLDMQPDTGEEAQERAQALMDRLAGRCARMEAVTIGLPELMPGICVEIVNGEASSLSGRIYVEEVRHLLDEEGYRTSVSGSRI